VIRVAVLGANGQVGAELCLLLARQPGIEVVPVCRNRTGSAFLRSMGLACRHGEPSDYAATGALYGDCDVVANLALVPTLRNPGAARRQNRDLIENVGRRLGPRGRHIYFSTMSVKGDAEVGEWLVFPGLYGADKSRSEALALASGSQSGCPTWVLRLGHVCGELQGITREIRSALQSGPVALPDPERLANVTHLPALVDAILRLAAGDTAPGTYDLFNTPPWTWQELLEREARQAGTPLAIRRIADRGRGARLRSVTAAVRAAAATLLRDERVRMLGGRVAGSLPHKAYRTLKARYAIGNAAADIAALGGAGPVVAAVFRQGIPGRALPGLRPTRELLEEPAFAPVAGPVGPAFPADLPPAGSRDR
jgi:nucleoside-diphosphate-sugar epimerase